MTQRAGVGMMLAGAGLLALRGLFWALGLDAAVAVVSGGVAPGWNDPAMAALVGAVGVGVHLAAVTLGPVLVLAGVVCVGVHPRVETLVPGASKQP